MPTPNFRTRIPMMTAATIYAAALAAGPDVTPAERQKALQYLDQTRDGVLAAVKGLSEEQWKFKPAPDRWSIAEVMEHIAIVEGLFDDSVRPQLENGAPPPKDRNVEQLDALILSKLPDRTTKFQAPPEIQPTGRWTHQEALDHFLGDRRKTIEYMQSATSMRQHTVTHPVLGALDGYEWVLLAAGHSERHTKQILEVKADPHFPVN
ncbi:MAG: DinB family protein [Bryobacteraceae bacterium]